MYTNSCPVNFGNKNAYQKNLKKIIDEDKLDDFVISTIKKAKDESNGIIDQYRGYLTNSEKKRFKADLQGSLDHYVINNNLHIIKHGNQKNTFIEEIKEIQKK